MAFYSCWFSCFCFSKTVSQRIFCVLRDQSKWMICQYGRVVIICLLTPCLRFRKREIGFVPHLIQTSSYGRCQNEIEKHKFPRPIFFSCNILQKIEYRVAGHSFQKSNCRGMFGLCLAHYLRFSFRPFTVFLNRLLCLFDVK